MFGFRQKKNEDIEKFDFRDEDTEKVDMPMNTESKLDETLPAFDIDTILGTKATETMENRPEERLEISRETQETPEIPKENPEPEPVEHEPTQSVNKEELEELSKKIESENRNIDRRFKIITKNVNQLSLESQELIDLIKLYANTNDKFQEFIEDMRKLEGRGWKFDQNIAALYKFRVGMALAKMKKQSTSVEKVCRKVGFTPSNIKTILKSPIEELVNSLNDRSIIERKIRR
jgi:hypothetical protein